MKKYTAIIVCMLVLLSCIPLGVSAMSLTVHAEIDNAGVLRINGEATDGAFPQMISLLVAKPEGQGLSHSEILLDYPEYIELIAQTETDENGNYSYEHKLTDITAAGDYSVMVGIRNASDTNEERTVTVHYNPVSNYVEGYVENGIIKVKGTTFTNSSNREVAVFIAKPAGLTLEPTEIMSAYPEYIEAVGQATADDNGVFAYEHTIENQALYGVYKVVIGFDDAEATVAERVVMCRYSETAEMTADAFFTSNGEVVVFGKTSGSVTVSVTEGFGERNSVFSTTANAENGSFYITASLSEQLSQGSYVINVTNSDGENKTIDVEFYGFDAEYNIRLFVSPYADGNGCGSEESPFAQISEALELVEKIRNKGENITIYLRGGDHFLSESVKLSSLHNLSDGKTLTIKSYPMENAVINGGRLITGWREGDSGIWYTDVNVGDFRELYVNGTPAIRAKSEESYTALGWLNNSGRSYSDSLHFSNVSRETVAMGALHRYNHPDRNNIVARAPMGFRGGLMIEKENGELAGIETWKNPEDIELIHNSLWKHNRMGVSDVITMSGSDLELDGNYPVLVLDKESAYNSTEKTSSYPWHWYFDFVVENAFELLDEPNEWYYDKADMRLYYMPPEGVDMATAVVEVPQLEKLVDICGAIGSEVENVTFENLTFKNATWLGLQKTGYATRQAGVLNTLDSVTEIVPAAISLNYTDGITFSGIKLTQSGGAGINLEEGAVDTEISDSEFYYIGASAVSVGLPSHDEITENEAMTTNTLIKNNEVHACAMQYTGNTGIVAYYTAELEILNNEVYNLPYTGISVGWGWNGDSVTGAQNNTIAYNRIYDVMQTQGWDGSAIYTLGNQPGTVIHDNYVRHTTLCLGGIYLDSSSRNITVKNNVIEATDEVIEGKIYDYYRSTYPEYNDGDAYKGTYQWLCWQNTCEITDNYSNCSSVWTERWQYEMEHADSEEEKAAYQAKIDSAEALLLVNDFTAEESGSFPDEAALIMTSSGRHGLFVSSMDFVHRPGMPKQELMSDYEKSVYAVVRIKGYGEDTSGLTAYTAAYKEAMFKSCTLNGLTVKKDSDNWCCFSVNTEYMSGQNDLGSKIRFYLWNNNYEPVISVRE